MPAAWETLTSWLDSAVQAITRISPERTFFAEGFNVYALLAVLLVSLCCGAVGSLVIGSRMAFFSDALAHCAFAGVSIGYCIFEFVLQRPEREFWEWVTPIMAVFGIFVGVGIAYVRTNTTLASDTVIGVFFAGAIGLAAMLQNLFKSRALFNMEDFLFGNPLNVQKDQVALLMLLTLFTAAVLAWLYNHLLLSSFNSSLALSRRVPVQWCNYVFVMLLAVIVNLCLRTVGVLLINALLVVPAATAANVSRNMRQLFWFTLLLTVSVSGLGLILSHEIEASHGIQLGISGSIVMLSVTLFFLSMAVRRLIERSWRVRLASRRAIRDKE